MPTVGELLSGAVERLRAGRLRVAAARRGSSSLPPLSAPSGPTLLAHPEAPVGDGAAERYEAGLARRAPGEPVAYIRGLKEFFGLAFGADERALIPRPETERLVEAGLAAVMPRLAWPGRGRDGAPVRVVDVGTGSGAIIISLAVELRRRRVDLVTDVMLAATETSPAALDLARENAVGHAVGDAVEFIEADLLPDVLPGSRDPFDIVLANLPYVRSDAIAGLPIAASFEPAIALDGATGWPGRDPPAPRRAARGAGRRRRRPARDRRGPGRRRAGRGRGDPPRLGCHRRGRSRRASPDPPREPRGRSMTVATKAAAAAGPARATPAFPIGLIALDLDGTLVDDSLLLRERTAAAVRAAIARGVSVSIVTGRMATSALRFARELGIGDPIVAYQGALIRAIPRARR